MSDAGRFTVVRLTPPGRGAIASIAVEGPGALEAVGRHFQPASSGALATAGGERPVFGRFGGPRGEEVIIRAIATDAVEIHCHGGHAAVERITRLLVGEGGRRIAWEQRTADSESDPIRAAALLALAEARTERAAGILLDQYHGALRRAVESAAASLRRAAADAVALDAAARDAAAAELRRLLDRARLGRRLTSPWRVATAGPPNAGKSSLMNALVGYRRAIVHATPGTTRDVVTAVTAIDGWPFEFADTAGLRDAEHPIEQAGIDLARKTLDEADLVVLVFDGSLTDDPARASLLAEYPNALVVDNKCDLASPTDATSERAAFGHANAGADANTGAPAGGLRVSALRGDGLDALCQAMVARLASEGVRPGEAVPFTAEQQSQLTAAWDAFQRGATLDAAAALESGPFRCPTESAQT